MASETASCFDALQLELEKAKSDLKGVDENLKKLIGRDPCHVPFYFGSKRPAETQIKDVCGRGDSRGLERAEEEPWSAKKRRYEPKVLFSRLNSLRTKRPVSPDEKVSSKPTISSRVIAKPKETSPFSCQVIATPNPSRQEVMAAQVADEKSNARNRRMFGALVGTLQKFRQEETRLKNREEKKAQVEKKLEENAKREKEELKMEKQKLFQEKRNKQAEIKKIELKISRIKEQDEWESKHRYLLNFIQTRVKPCIFYLPKAHNEKTEARLVASQKRIAKLIEKKRKEVRVELEAIENRGPWRQVEEVNDSELNITVGHFGNKENEFEEVEKGDIRTAQVQSDTYLEIPTDVIREANGNGIKVEKGHMQGEQFMR